MFRPKLEQQFTVRTIGSNFNVINISTDYASRHAEEPSEIRPLFHCQSKNVAILLISNWRNTIWKNLHIFKLPAIFKNENRMRSMEAIDGTRPQPKMIPNIIESLGY